MDTMLTNPTIFISYPLLTNKNLPPIHGKSKDTQNSPPKWWATGKMDKIQETVTWFVRMIKAKKMNSHKELEY